VRSQLENLLWKEFWETVFFISSWSGLFLGTALGNLLRGFSLGAKGHFFLPLWADFLPGAPIGILDWFTIMIGLLAVSTVTLHGANFLMWKTKGDIQQHAGIISTPFLWSSGGTCIAYFGSYPYYSTQGDRTFHDPSLMALSFPSLH